MKKVFAILATIILAVLVTIPAHADTAAWYQVSFTGADIWTYSADNALESRTDQAAPRRYRDYTLSDPLVATTYGLNGGSPTTGFQYKYGCQQFRIRLTQPVGRRRSGRCSMGRAVCFSRQH